MSGTAQKWAWMQELPMPQKLVLVALAWHADDEGLAWPKLRTLVNELPLSRRGIIIQIKKLESAGYLSKEISFRDSGAQTTNRYKLDIGGVQLSCMGGVQQDVHGGDAANVHGGDEQTGAPHNIQYNIQDKIQSTGDKSQEDEYMNLEDVMNQHAILEREDIFRNALRKNDKLTADGCGYLWRHCRASAGDNGFQAELLIKDKKMLHSAYGRVGEDYNLAVWAVMTDWIGFTKAAAASQGAFNMPLKPTVSFFIKFIETAMEFTASNGFSGNSGFVQVAAKTVDPLTKPKESKDNEHTAITSEELAAISEGMEE